MQNFTLKKNIRCQISRTKSQEPKFQDKQPERSLRFKIWDFVWNLCFVIWFF
jgi:hypothetical protein